MPSVSAPGRPCPAHQRPGRPAGCCLPASSPSSTQQLQHLRRKKGQPGPFPCSLGPFHHPAPAPRPWLPAALSLPSQKATSSPAPRGSSLREERTSVLPEMPSQCDTWLCLGRSWPASSVSMQVAPGPLDSAVCLAGSESTRPPARGGWQPFSLSLVGRPASGRSWFVPKGQHCLSPSQASGQLSGHSQASSAAPPSSHSP